MTIDIVSGLFSNIPNERIRLTTLFRNEIFKSFSESDEYGMIFTFMWALDSQEDWDYINLVETIFKDKGAEVFYIELEAEYNLRLERNKTENRLLNKPSKRDLKHSEHLFKLLEEKYRLNSYADEIKKEKYMKIDNTNLEPSEVARMIKEKFEL